MFNFPEMSEQVAPPGGRQRLQQIDSFQIDQQAIGHGHRLFAQTLLGVFENNPLARGFVVNLLCQSLLEAGIGFSLQRHQMRREVAALGGCEAFDLLLQLGKTHADNIRGGNLPSTGEKQAMASIASLISSTRPCTGSFYSLAWSFRGDLFASR